MEILNIVVVKTAFFEILCVDKCVLRKRSQTHVTLRIVIFCNNICNDENVNIKGGLGIILTLVNR